MDLKITVRLVHRQCSILKSSGGLLHGQILSSKVELFLTSLWGKKIQFPNLHSRSDTVKSKEFRKSNDHICDMCCCRWCWTLSYSSILDSFLSFLNQKKVYISKGLLIKWEQKVWLKFLTESVLTVKVFKKFLLLRNYRIKIRDRKS